MSLWQLTLEAVILAVTEGFPRVHCVRDPGGHARLCGGGLDPAAEKLEAAMRTLVRTQTGLELAYIEQLYTFGDRQRGLAHDLERVDLSARTRSTRDIAVAYMALVREGPALKQEASWRTIYDFLPWEDRRSSAGQKQARTICDALLTWAGSDTARRLRLEQHFGLQADRFAPERTLERYELLWEAGLVAEAPHAEQAFGEAMAADHRRILASALGRLRGKLSYRPVVFELLPPQFTLFQLQQTVEVLAGIALHKQNFRRLVEQGGLVEGTGQVTSLSRGRPAELFQFRAEVLRERPAPGVHLPGW